jgi:hypothetical protein
MKGEGGGAGVGVGSVSVSGSGDTTAATTRSVSISSHARLFAAPLAFVVLQGTPGDGVASTTAGSQREILLEALAAEGEGEDRLDCEEGIDGGPLAPSASSSSSEAAAAGSPALLHQSLFGGALLAAPQPQLGVRPANFGPGATAGRDRNDDRSAASGSSSSSPSSSSSSLVMVAAAAPPEAGEGADGGAFRSAGGGEALSAPAVQRGPPRQQDAPLGPRGYRPREQEAIARWREEGRRREVEHHREFVAGLSPEQLRQFALAPPPSAAYPSINVDDPSSSPALSSSHWPCWWIDRETGNLKVFDRLPGGGAGESADDGIRRTLPPGTCVRAVGWHKLDAHTLRPVSDEEAPPPGAAAAAAPARALASEAAASTADEGERPEARPDVPRGEAGQILFLEIDEPVRGCVVHSWNGYCYVAPGEPELYSVPAGRWLWRVTCPNGAYVREGLYLGSKLVKVIPFGHLVEVQGKSINAQGLSRLQVQYAEQTGGLVAGWCSEFLNPMSGQRGPILQPVPTAVPALLTVALEEGAVVREGVELASPLLGRARRGATLRVVSRSFSEHPGDRCLQRLGLAGSGGYVSLRLNNVPPQDLLVVEEAGIDPDFDPCRPGSYHLEWIRRVRRAKRESYRRLLESAVGSPSPQLSPDVSSIDEDEDDSDRGGEVEEAEDDVVDLAATASPRVERRAGQGAAVNEEEAILQMLIDMYAPIARQGSSPIAELAKEASVSAAHGQPHHRQQEQHPRDGLCLICQTDDRTATIVHGETGHICCCLVCARILKARRDPCPVCRHPIDLVVQHFWA